MNQTNLPPIAVGAPVAAQLLDVSERTLATYTQKGMVPHFRIGNRVLYSVDALREWAHKQALAQSLDGPQQPANNPADKEAA